MVQHGSLEDALTLTNVDTNQSLSVILGTPIDEGGKTSIELTFGNGESVVERALGLSANSLSDGNYRLDIAATKLRPAEDTRAMATDFVFGGERVGNNLRDDFFRLFGDTDGDRDVDGQDYGRFAQSFLQDPLSETFDPGFDFDGDGDVDGQDYSRFGRRFLKRLQP